MTLDEKVRRKRLINGGAAGRQKVAEYESHATEADVKTVLPDMAVSFGRWNAPSVCPCGPDRCLDPGQKQANPEE